MSALLTTVLAATFLGCDAADSSPKQTLIPVSGQVTMGRRPVSGVSVLFLPVNKGSRARGLTNAKGRYTLMDESESPGVSIGEYRVIFSNLGVGLGEQLSRIHDTYKTEETTPVRATVDAQTSVLNFDLLPLKHKP